VPQILRTNPVGGPTGWELLIRSCSFLVCGATAAHATDLSQFHSRIWQTDSGLPNNTVQAVVQTRDGYLWLGTQYGLARFDGVHFTIFNRNNVPEMRNSNILGLREARDGSLWIATGSGGVLRLRDGNFVHYGKAEGLAHDFTLGSILETTDGAIWVGTLGGLSRLKDGKFSTFTHTNGLSDNPVRDLCQDQQGTLWIGTGAGLDYYGSNGVIRPAPFANGFKGADVRAICCDSNGVTWFAAGNELHRLQNGKHTLFTQGKGLPYNIIRRLYPDREGNLWVGSYGGLSRFQEGKFVPQSGSDGLPFDLVSALFEDREGDVWVGSRDGLTQFQAKRLMTYTAEQGLPNNNVMSILEDRAGTVWIGTWGGGVSGLKDGTFTIHSNRTDVPVLALALHEDRIGRLWVGTDYAGGLFCFNGESVQQFTPAQGLPGRAIRVIFEDSHTNLWVGTSQGLYVGRQDAPMQDGQGLKARMKFRQVGTEQGLATAIVREILEDRTGKLWVGTEQGLWRFEKDKVVNFTTNDGLSENAVISIYEDPAGDLWIGTAGGGLNRFRDGSFAAFTTKNGLFSDTICEILEDERGWLWMSCPRGIFRVNKHELESCAQGASPRVKSIAYGKGDGMMSELCNGVAKPGAWKSRDGRLWFATSKGACVVDPNAQTDEDRSPPTVVLERAFADKQPFPGKETLPVTAPLRVRPGNGELEFYYTALSFRAPERNRFKYKLEGVNEDWVDAGARRVASYYNIGPGTYHFQVIACNDSGIWNETGATAVILLLPHIWQTTWFRVALVAAVGLVFLALHRLRLARLREIDRFRLRLAADLHDDIGSNLSTISLLSRRAQKHQANGEAPGDDLAAINRISRQTASAIREIVWLINPEYDTMRDLVTRMKEAADSILVGIDCQFQSPEADLSHKLTLQFRQNVFLLYKETLTNVARHARASRVEIKVEQNNGDWRLTVHDNGVGFDPQESYSGNGLKNLRLRAAKLNGALALESQPGRGTTVSFSAKQI
jgi:ligand-binding sensor domain-containing protein/signal transduction histidine kinase